MFLAIAEWQKNATEFLGYTLTKNRNDENVVNYRDSATASVKIVITGVICYSPRYAPNAEQQVKLSELILSKTPTEIHFIERSVLIKEVNTQIL